MRRIVSVFPLSLAVGCASIYGDSNALDPLPPPTTEHLARPARPSAPSAPYDLDQDVRRTLDRIAHYYARAFNQSRILLVMVENPYLRPDMVAMNYRFIDRHGGVSALPALDDVQLLFTRGQPVIAILVPSGYDQICFNAVRPSGRADELGYAPIYARFGIGPIHRLHIQRRQNNNSLAVLGCLDL